MEEGEKGSEKDAREEPTGPPDAEEQGADRAAGLADPGDTRDGGADRTTGLAGPGVANSGGADQTTGLAGPRGVRGGGTTPVVDPLDVGGQDEMENPTRQGMRATLAYLEQQASFVFTAPSPTQRALLPAVAQTTQQGMGTSSGPSARQMAGPSGTNPQHRASGSSTGPSADPGIVSASGPSGGGPVDRALDVSAEDEAVWDEFQMFKFFLEMRKRGNVAAGASTAVIPPRGRANPSPTVQTSSPDAAVDDVDRGSDGQPNGDDDNSLRVVGQSQATGQLQAAVQSTLMQTIAQSLVAPAQQDPPAVAAVRVPAVAQQTMAPQQLIPSIQTVAQPSAILAAPKQPHNPVPVLLPAAPAPVASSLVRVDVPSDIPTSAPVSFPEVDPYIAILEKQGQILEKLADTTRATSIKPVVPKPPEQYKLKADIRSWLSQFDTDLSLTRVEDSNKAQYLLTNLSSEASEQVSKAQWAGDTLVDYAKLKDALKLKFGPSENPMIYRSQFAVAERGQTESAVNFLERLRDLLKHGYPESDLQGLEPRLVNQFSR